MEGTVWDNIPAEVWIEIFIKSNCRNQYDEIIYDMRVIVDLMQCSHFFNDLLEMNVVWRAFCSTFHDYERLVFMHEQQELTWKEIYKNRITKVLQTEEITIGDPSAPEDYILFQIMGNGKVYVSSDWVGNNSYALGEYATNHNTSPALPRNFSRRHSMNRLMVKHGCNLYTMVPITEVNTVITQLYKKDAQEQPLLHKVASILPFTAANREQRTKKQTIDDIRGGYFVSIASYSPYVLLLSKTGQVFEFMFLPKHVQDCQGRYVPREVAIPLVENEKIVYVTCTPIGNFAVSNRDRLFAWTSIENHETHRHENTQPALIAELTGKKVKKIEYVSEKHSNIICANTTLTVENAQLYYLIIQNRLF